MEKWVLLLEKEKRGSVGVGKKERKKKGREEVVKRRGRELKRS
jgi:hypothetical protein